ncbi:MAG TPA: SagB/ThcOx family dehydrogenase [Bacillales bacterium]|nr:SagB/ThcOx family dehydrogenase [Bacillales bacterium]
MQLFKNYHEGSNWPPAHKPESPRKSEKPKPANMIDLDDAPVNQKLSDSIIARRSSKSINQDQTLNKRDLGTFLKWSIGCLETEKDRRTYPSAGSLYPNRFFVEVKQVPSLGAGLYEYLPEHHALTQVSENVDIESALVQPDIDFNFCVVVAADFDYAIDQYGERGYRFCLLEAGHMVQNMMLVAAAMDKAIAPIGGFKDKIVNQDVLPDKKSLSALYLVPVGQEI